MKEITIFLFIINSISSLGQVYHSKFEEDIFKSYKSDSLNYDFFDSLLTIDSTITKDLANTYKDEVKTYLKRFPQKEKKAKKEKNRILRIYNDLHNNFLKKYESNSFFSEIFQNGNYNCVSASGLYAFAFDELNIPYHVKEAPSHVYLIVYPETLKIYLETTVPGEFGFLTPNEKEIRKIVDQLIAVKLTTKNEVAEKGYVKFYEDYYYGKEYIDKSALIGMQYYNLGILQFQEDELLSSKSNFDKSKLFFKSPILKSILTNLTLKQLENLEFNSEQDIVFLKETLNDNTYKNELTSKQINYILYSILEKDNAYIKAAINQFLKIEDEENRTICLEYLYKYLAKNEASNENQKEAIFYSDKLLELKPDSKVAKQIIEYFCFKKASLSSFNLKGLEEFESTVKKFPFIESSHRYNVTLCYFYGNISYKNYSNKNISEAASYRKKFENTLDSNKLLEEVRKSLIFKLYLKAGNYYYYKNQYQSSYNIYKKGLSYLPDSNELIKRAKWAKEEL